MRKILTATALCCLAWPANGVELTGRYGYAGEWALTAKFTEDVPKSPAASLAGELQLKHLARCGPGEVSQKTGTIGFQRAGRRYAATITIDGQSCTVSGALSQDSVAFADCGKGGQVPLRLWLQ